MDAVHGVHVGDGLLGGNEQFGFAMDGKGEIIRLAGKQVRNALDLDLLTTVLIGQDDHILAAGGEARDFQRAFFADEEGALIACSVITGLFTGLCAQILVNRGKDIWKTFFK
jgi:hypothetical protein